MTGPELKQTLVILDTTVEGGFSPEPSLRKAGLDTPIIPWAGEHPPLFHTSPRSPTIEMEAAVSPNLSRSPSTPPRREPSAVSAPYSPRRGVGLGSSLTSQDLLEAGG